MPTTAQNRSDATPHPLPLRLAAFGLGKLDEGESSRIAEHLSACDACRSLVESVVDDSLAGLLRRANGPPAIPEGAGASTGGGGAVDGDSPPGYVVLEVLGEGGMGVVSKARQVALGRLVALKQVRPEVLAGRDGVARFRREAEAAARLRHPNIVPIYDVGWRGEVPYYSMEYVEGGTLARALAAGPIPPRDAARLVETLARAVQHAHDSGVVHRDLKPANILLAPDLEHPKVGDFGLAKLDDDSTRTRSGVLLGTPNYMSPEQAEGDSGRVGPAADVYALGAILYEALAGRPPFQAPSVLETLERVRLGGPTPPRRVRDGVPRDLETIALKCLERATDRRYASALALAGDLRRHLDGEPILARAASPPERLAKWAGRRPWQATSAALVAVVLFGTLAGTLAHNARLREEVRRTEREAGEARAQRGRAEDQYRSARDAIRRMLGRLDEPRFAGRPLGGELGIRRQLLEDALTFYRGAARDDAGAGAGLAARLDKVHALQEVATYQIMLGKPGDGLASLRAALDVLDALGREGRAGPEVDDERAVCLGKLGVALEGLGRLDEARATYADAIARIERSRPETLARLDNLAWFRHNLGSSFLLANRPGEAEAHLAGAAEARRGLLRDHPGEVDLRMRLAETLINLAQAHSQLGRRGLVEAEYAEAASGLAPHVVEHPEQGSYATSLGKLYLNWGWLALEAKRVDLAIERFRAGLQGVDGALRAIPDWPEARGGSSQLNSALALALGDAGRHREAVDAWDRAIALAGPGPSARTYRLGRLASLAREGGGRRALDEARAMAGDPEAPLSGLDLYNFACVAAVVAGSGGDPGQAEAAALQAIRWLRSSLEAGTFRDPGMIRALDGDSDLAPLRPRPDFQLLKLDAAFPANPFRPDR